MFLRNYLPIFLISPIFFNFFVDALQLSNRFGKSRRLTKRSAHPDRGWLTDIDTYRKFANPAIVHNNEQHHGSLRSKSMRYKQMHLAGISSSSKSVATADVATSLSGWSNKSSPLHILHKSNPVVGSNPSSIAGNSPPLHDYGLRANFASGWNQNKQPSKGSVTDGIFKSPSTMSISRQLPPAFPSADTNPWIQQHNEEQHQNDMGALLSLSANRGNPSYLPMTSSTTTHQSTLRSRSMYANLRRNKQENSLSKQFANTHIGHIGHTSLSHINPSSTFGTTNTAMFAVTVTQQQQQQKCFEENNGIKCPFVRDHSMRGPSAHGDTAWLAISTTFNPMLQQKNPFLPSSELMTIKVQWHYQILPPSIYSIGIYQDGKEDLYIHEYAADTVKFNFICAFDTNPYGQFGIKGLKNFSNCRPLPKDNFRWIMLIHPANNPHNFRVLRFVNTYRELEGRITENDIGGLAQCDSYQIQFEQLHPPMVYFAQMPGHLQRIPGMREFFQSLLI